MSTQRPRQPHHRGEPTKERASKFVQSFPSTGSLVRVPVVVLGFFLFLGD